MTSYVFVDRPPATRIYTCSPSIIHYDLPWATMIGNRCFVSGGAVGRFRVRVLWSVGGYCNQCPVSDGRCWALLWFFVRLQEDHHSAATPSDADMLSPTSSELLQFRVKNELTPAHYEASKCLNPFFPCPNAFHNQRYTLVPCPIVLSFCVQMYLFRAQLFIPCPNLHFSFCTSIISVSNCSSVSKFFVSVSSPPNFLRCRMLSQYLHPLLERILSVLSPLSVSTS